MAFCLISLMVLLQAHCSATQLDSGSSVQVDAPRAFRFPTRHPSDSAELLQVSHHADMLQHDKPTPKPILNMSPTKMDQSKLGKDSKHVNQKTVTADWRQEYAVNTTKPVKDSSYRPACHGCACLVVLSCVFSFVF
eukprot:gnl/MRDRNA2_/MRDRNA2_90757_c0_seq1.p1 gnl/MRDRNA2_/MRDRNA2_90757_c0~~gnl/MRDRNA2_/MRDRNA2_90757_c0_seq1.p1  ORF type:complete len:136 (+),score=13.01 gnl/MRDRNA2_/MRDRNA2_90757_c0_seq1:77-484(+)